MANICKFDIIKRLLNCFNSEEKEENLKNQKTKKKRDTLILYTQLKRTQNNLQKFLHTIFSKNIEITFTNLFFLETYIDGKSFIRRILNLDIKKLDSKIKENFQNQKTQNDIKNYFLYIILKTKIYNGQAFYNNIMFLKLSLPNKIKEYFDYLDNHNDYLKKITQTLRKILNLESNLKFRIINKRINFYKENLGYVIKGIIFLGCNIDRIFEINSLKRLVEILKVIFNLNDKFLLIVLRLKMNNLDVEDIIDYNNHFVKEFIDVFFDFSSKNMNFEKRLENLKLVKILLKRVFEKKKKEFDIYLEDFEKFKVRLKNFKNEDKKLKQKNFRKKSKDFIDNYQNIKKSNFLDKDNTYDFLEEADTDSFLNEDFDDDSRKLSTIKELSSKNEESLAVKEFREDFRDTENISNFENRPILYRKNSLLLRKDKF